MPGITYEWLCHRDALKTGSYQGIASAMPGHGDFELGLQPPRI